MTPTVKQQNMQYVLNCFGNQTMSQFDPNSLGSELWSAYGLFVDAQTDTGTKIVEGTGRLLKFGFNYIGKQDTNSNTSGKAASTATSASSAVPGNNNTSDAANAASSAASAAKTATGSSDFSQIGALLSGATQENLSAQREIKEGEANAESLEKSIATSVQNTQAKIDEIVAAIKEKAEKVQEKLDEIESASKEKEQLEKELEDARKIIDEETAKVNNPDTPLKEKRECLNRISEAGNTINALAGRVDELISSISDSMEEVQGIEQNINDLNDEHTTVLDAGTQEQQQYENQLTAQKATNDSLLAKATKNEENARLLEAAAREIETTGSALGVVSLGSASVTAEAEALKLRQAANDNRAAAKTRTEGAAKIQGRLTTVGNANQQYLQNLTDTYPSTVGSAVEDGKNNVLSYYDNSNSLGSALPEASTFESAAANLQAAVENSVAKLDGKITQKDGENEEEGKNQLFNYNTSELDLFKSAK